MNKFKNVSFLVETENGPYEISNNDGNDRYFCIYKESDTEPCFSRTFRSVNEAMDFIRVKMLIKNYAKL